MSLERDINIGLATTQSKLVISPDQNTIYFEKSIENGGNHCSVGSGVNALAIGGSSQNSMSTDNNFNTTNRNNYNIINLNENTINSVTSKGANKKKRDRKPDKQLVMKNCNSLLRLGQTEGNNAAPSSKHEGFTLSADEPKNLKRTRALVENVDCAMNMNMSNGNNSRSSSNKSSNKSTRGHRQTQKEIEVTQAGSKPSQKDQKLISQLLKDNQKLKDDMALMQNGSIKAKDQELQAKEEELQVQRETAK